MDWKRGEVASRAVCSDTYYSVVVIRQTLLSSNRVKFRLGWGGAGGGAGGWGLGALGSTGLVLPGTAQNPVRLVYGSAALVASLRGQHFATSPRFQLLASSYKY